MSRALRCARGQATVEVVALLPVLAAVVLAVVLALAAGAAARAADAAAAAGALAALQEGDPAAAAGDALRGWPHHLRDVRVRGDRVEVTVRPKLPASRLARLLAATSVARAGPLGDAPASAAPPRGGDGAGSEGARP